ncbi:unnamed protein product [Lymnaea stagnalis]|uniref:Fibrinogen C-terminal domain-containing protein n=1 Tax=Lymnaea stagnalis TaxID=6523 RepID=A0AAV2IDI4_LYMST
MGQASQVYCESAGGWTVIQKRTQGNENFTRGWEYYAHGFGHPVRDYWIGNDVIHALTSQGKYELRIVMEDTFSETWEARYELFNISSKEDDYRLYVAGYQGNATDSLSASTRAQFSTYDRDSDSGSSHCARYNGGGWWYSQCHMSNLNGAFDIGMVWFHKEWKDWLQLRATTMMIRPRNIVR